MQEVLVNRLRGLSLPRKSVVRLTDHPKMTLDVYHGRKTTTQQQPIEKGGKNGSGIVASPESVHIYCNSHYEDSHSI